MSRAIASELNGFSPWRVEWHAELTSTMDCASELAAAGAPPGTVVVADFQSRGRGTHGRDWRAPPGTCLMFTLIADFPTVDSELAELPRRIARSIVEALGRETGLEAEVDPPNDVTVNGRKICGVLCTSRFRGEQVEWLVCGIGLNTRMTETELPVENATSLAIEGVEPLPSHADLLAALLSNLDWLCMPGHPG